MINILRRILFLILVVNFFVSNTVSADDRKKNKKQQYSASAIAEKAKTSIVTIKVYDKVGNNIGLGTGFFVSNNGKIVTNYHVIENAISVKVELENGEKFNDVYLLSSSQQRDIAVIKIPVENVTFIALGDDNKIKQGDQIYVIGNPLGLERTFSDGVVSAKRVADGTQFIQITAPISQGSSGGPVLNKSGEAIAIASMIFTKGQNLNLSVPSKYIKPLIDTKETPIKFNNTIGLQTADTNKQDREFRGQLT